MPVAELQSCDSSSSVQSPNCIGGKADPIGDLKDYITRIKFQARVSLHAHTILKMKDAPKLDVNNDEEGSASSTNAKPVAFQLRRRVAFCPKTSAPLHR